MESENTFSIYHDLNINSSSKHVYDAITLPIHLNNWWPLKSTGTPLMGETYNLNFTDEYDWYGQVQTCETNSSFYIKMTKSDLNWIDTVFGFDIIETNKGVQLKFNHLNWKACNIEFRQSSFCWAMLLNGLKNYVEKGIIIPFEERE